MDGPTRALAGGQGGLDLVDGAALIPRAVRAAEPGRRQLTADALPQDTDDDVEGLHGRDRLLKPSIRLVEVPLPPLGRKFDVGGVDTV